METNKGRILCLSFTKAYPIRNGTASITSCSCPAAAQSDLRADAPSIGTNFPWTGAAKGMPDTRRASDARSCAHVHRHSTQTSGGLGAWVPQGEECDCDRPAVRQGTELLGRAFLARGYAVSTVGFELEQVRQYIREQEIADGNGGQF